MRALWDLFVTGAAFINHLNLVLVTAFQLVIAIGSLLGLCYVVFTSQE